MAVMGRIGTFIRDDYCFRSFGSRSEFDNDNWYFISLNGGALVERRINVADLASVPLTKNVFVSFPHNRRATFGVYDAGTRELDLKNTIALFGATCDELNEIFPAISLVLFNTGPLIDPYLRGLRITSSRGENHCALTDCWIPADFPYITCNEGGYVVDHLSLHGFYNLLAMMCGSYTRFQQELDHLGVKQELLSRIGQRWVSGNIVYDPEVRPTPRSYYGE